MVRPKMEPGPRGATLGVLDLMVWVAGLAAIAGLIEETIRLTRVEPAAGLVGGFLVVYVVYVSLSVPLFWKAAPLTIPTTMLVAGALWTIALQVIDRKNLTTALVVLPIIPFLTAFLVRTIFRRAVDPSDRPTDPGRPSTARSLLMKNRGFGPRPEPVEVGTDAERSEFDAPA